jgi:hypothetical protein
MSPGLIEARRWITAAQAFLSLPAQNDIIRRVAELSASVHSNTSSPFEPQQLPLFLCDCPISFLHSSLILFKSIIHKPYNFAFVREDEPFTGKTQTFSRFFAGVAGHTILGSAALDVNDTAVAVNLPPTTLLNCLFHHATGALNTRLGCGDRDSETARQLDLADTLVLRSSKASR